MKPIHNSKSLIADEVIVVIPHKVNDLNETNSQLVVILYFLFKVVIPHKVNDLNETNSQRLVVLILIVICCDSSQS